MSFTRRAFIGSLGVAAAGTISSRWLQVSGQSAPALALPLGAPGFCINLGRLSGAHPTITAYSGYAYCTDVAALLLFGGGHAATSEDVVLRFPVATLQWEADYVATPRSARILEHLTPGKFWQVPGQIPPLRPIARHTYTGFVWSSAIKRMLLLVANGGLGYGEIPETVKGNMAEYDPSTRTWEDTGVPGARWSNVFAEDPVSGHILAYSAQGLRVYDPRQRRWIASSPSGPIAGIRGGENLVYYPPNDRFYYLSLNASLTGNGPATFEFAFDRSTLKPVFADGKSKPLATNFRPRASLSGAGTGYAYDAANQLIVGGMLKGMVYGFRPLGQGRGEWLQHPVPTTNETSSYCHAYVADIDAHLITTSVTGVGKCTFAFRWDPGLASVAADSRLPAPEISANGTKVLTLQEACDIGGSVTMTAGALYGAPACATIDKPVEIHGDRTVLNATGIAGKGILIVNSDTRLVNLDLSGAAVADGNGAAIRHQSGKLTLEQVDLHDCQNGLLAGASDAEIVVDDCDVHGNGTGTGQTHGLYVGRIGRFTCVNSRFSATSIGHHVKTRAQVSVIQGCVIGTDFSGTESYNIDAPSGGDVVVTDCVLRQGPKTDNAVMLNFGGEPGPHPGGSLTVSRCTFESTTSRGIGVRNLLPNVVALVEDCSFVGVETPVVGNVTMRRCTLDGVALPDSEAGQTSGLTVAPASSGRSPAGRAPTPRRPSSGAPSR